MVALLEAGANVTGIVIELQKEAMDKDVRVSDLLRKALLVARKLKNLENESWILSELNGYRGEVKYPEYRFVNGKIKALNAYTGQMLPLVWKEKIEESVWTYLTRRPTGQPIAEIESMISKKDGGELHLAYPQDLGLKLMKGTDMDVPPVLVVQVAAIHGIIDAIRTAILDWALNLEGKGIVGENLSFSEEDKKAAANITIHIGSMHNSQIQADSPSAKQVLQISAIDPGKILELVESIRAKSPSLNLTKLQSDELESELSTLEAQAKSPKPKTGILHESLGSIDKILQGTAASAVGQGLILLLRSLIGA